MVPKSKLKKLQKDLKGKPMKPVADKIKKSEVHCYDILSGKYSNDETLEALIEYRDELKEKEKQLIDRI